MPAVVTNADVEQCLREILANEGFRLSRIRQYGETGVDIVARNGPDEFHIETIGYKKAGPARAKDFYEAFFRIVSRLNDGATRCIIALSDQARVGLPARAKQHRVAWLRIADTFPELAIWLVDTEKKTYAKTTWREWADSP